jgi:hypothetical protein
MNGREYNVSEEICESKWAAQRRSPSRNPLPYQLGRSL